MNRAIVIGDDHYNALSVVRSLGENNVPIILILTTTHRSFVEKSRYVNKVIKIEKDPNNLIRVLRDIIQDLEEPPVLFPLSDFAAEVIDNNYKELKNIAVTPNASGQIIKLMNKEIMSNIAQRAGIEVPEHACLNLNEDSLDWSIFPAIIKPLASIEGLKVDIVVVNDSKSLFQQLNIFKKKNYSKVLIERYISGENEYMLEVMGYSKKNGEVIVSGIIEKIREFPIKNGSTSFAKTIAKNEGINIKKIKDLIRSIDYYGIFDMEFKYADGLVYFIELNLRNGAPSYALSKLGCNMPYLWYCDAIGINKTYNEQMAREEIFMCEHMDFLHVLKHNISIYQWIKDYRQSKIKVFYNSMDKMPNVWYLMFFLKNCLLGIIKNRQK